MSPSTLCSHSLYPFPAVTHKVTSSILTLKKTKNIIFLIIWLWFYHKVSKVKPLKSLGKTYTVSVFVFCGAQPTKTGEIIIMMSYSYRAVRGKDIKMLSILDPGVKRWMATSRGPERPCWPGNFLVRAMGKANLFEHIRFFNFISLEIVTFMRKSLALQCEASSLFESMKECCWCLASSLCFTCCYGELP